MIKHPIAHVAHKHRASAKLASYTTAPADMNEPITAKFAVLTLRKYEALLHKRPIAIA